VTHSPFLKGSAIGALPVSVVVIAAPTRAEWRIDLQNRIHNPQRILDQRIARGRIPKRTSSRKPASTIWLAGYL